MAISFDTAKSLRELEGKKIEKPEFDSHLVQICYRLYDKPVCNFSIEDLRIMIGQNIGLEYLVPLAIEELKLNPLAQGDFYCGDLLKSVIKADKSFWETHDELKNEVAIIIQDTISFLDRSMKEFMG